MKWTLISDAIISPCQKYRYWLTRSWQEGTGVIFIGFNPSRASIDIRDHTDQKCEGIARRRIGVGWYGIINPFAFRATDPEETERENFNPRGDAVGPENNEHIIHAFRSAKQHGDIVVAAWGVLGAQQWAKSRIADVVQQAHHEGIGLHCIGLTKDGHPRHPLMVGYKQPIERLPDDWTPPA